MAEIQKPVTPPRRPVTTTQQRPKPATPTVAREAMGAARELLRDKLIEQRPYLKYAFKNPYNLSLFVGGLAAAGITLNPLLALIILGLEGLWLMHAPDSKRLRHILWDPRFERVRKALEEQERSERTKNLSPEQRERIERLVLRKEEIEDLAAHNPSFTADLLRDEVVKTGRLVESFIDMCVTTARYEDYLDSVNRGALEKDRERWEKTLRSSKEGDPQHEIAKKNFAIILKRVEKLTEIRQYLNVARGQLDLIENSFQLIADQIVTMQSPSELSGQLDELLDSVESIKQTAADTEKLLSTLGMGR